MGLSAVISDVDDRVTAPMARLPLSDVGDVRSDAWAAVRSVLDDELLGPMVSRMRGDGVPPDRAGKASRALAARRVAPTQAILAHGRPRSAATFTAASCVADTPVSSRPDR